MKPIHYLSDTFFWDCDRGWRNRSLFFLPTVAWIRYHQNTWTSETASLVFSWLGFYFQINFTKINREVNYYPTQEVLEKINDVLIANQLYIKNINKLNYALTNTAKRELVLLCKNIPHHPYLNTIILSVLAHDDECVAPRDGL